MNTAKLGKESEKARVGRYARAKVHFMDCVLAATAAADGVPSATFDQDFRSSPIYE
jgi:predicted nucleic acid-binding protein